MSIYLCRNINFIIRRLSIARVLIVAGSLRILSIILLRTFLHPQTWEFGTIAHAINSGFGYSYTTILPDGSHAPTAFIPPAYPYILAGLLRVFGCGAGTYFLIELINALLGTALVYIIYRTAVILIGDRSALLAAVFVAVYPAQVYMCNEFHSISYYIVLGAMVVWFLLRYLWISRSWTDISYAGLSMGILLLFRSEALGLLFIYAALIVFLHGWKSLKHAVVFVLLALLCIAPWLYRNYRVFDHHLVLSSSGAVNFWIGNNEHATGSQHYVYLDAFTPDQIGPMNAVPFTRDRELRQDRLFMQFATDFIRSHPKDEARLVLKKLFLFFVYDKTHEEGRRPLYWVPSVLLSCAAGLGILLRKKHLLHEDLLLIVTIFFTVSICMLFFVLPRYKIMIDPFLMIFAAYAVTGLWFRIKNHLFPLGSAKENS